MPADEFASASAVTARHAALEKLSTEFIDRLRRGEQPQVADFQARHPQLASSLGDLLPTVAALEGTAASSGLGEFRVLRELGRGGMGVVYLAEQPSLARRVALKVLPAAMADAAARARFQREARLAAGLAHPNITPVYAVGEGDGRPWFAMQLLHGVGLDQVIATLAAGATVTAGTGGFAALVRRMRDGVPVLKAREDWQDEAWLQRAIARLVASAADGLHYAHQKGVLHRDVKPANLILDVDGRLWVNDFGLAKAAGDVDVTSEDSITGTLLYLAPERFDGVTDRRSDVYSLGLVLHELLARRTAFAVESRTKLIKAIVVEGAPPLRFHAPTVPVELAAIVDRACARQPERRYGDAGSLARDLLAFADSPVAAAPRAGGPVPVPRAPGRPAEGAGLGRLVAVGALALAAWGAWSLLAPAAAPAPAPAAAPIPVAPSAPAPAEAPVVEPARLAAPAAVVESRAPEVVQSPVVVIAPAAPPAGADQPAAPPPAATVPGTAQDAPWRPPALDPAPAAVRPEPLAPTGRRPLEPLPPPMPPVGGPPPGGRPPPPGGGPPPGGAGPRPGQPGGPPPPPPRR